VASFNFGPLKSLTDYFSGGSQTPEPALPRRSTVLPKAPRRKSFLDELDDELNQPDELDQQEPDDFLKRLDESLKEPDELPPPKRYTSPFAIEPTQPATPATSRAAEPFRLPGTTPTDTAPLATAAPPAPFTPMKPVAAAPPPAAAAAPGIAPPVAAPLGTAPAAKQKYPFPQWYTLHALNYGLNPDPDAPGQDYDYRAAYEAGAEPDASGHWPSQFKKPGHANEVVGGFNTITGERVPGTKREGLGWLIEHGWEPETARQLVKLPEPKPTATPTPTSRTGLPQMPADVTPPAAGTPPSDERTPAQFTSALDRVMQRMADAGHPVRVVSSQRTAEQQQKLYAQGRSAPGPIVTELDGVNKKSLHQQGIAADLAFTGKDSQWALLGKIAKEEGLVWGGDWKTLKDYGHVQLGTALPASAPPTSALAPMKPMAAHEPATPAQQAAAAPQLPPMTPMAAHEKTKEEAKIGAAPPLDPLGFWDFVGGLFDRDPATGVPVLSKKGEAYIPFVGSAAEAADYADIWRAAVRVRDGEGTPADEKILRDFQERDLDEARRGTSLAYKVASTVAGLVPFAVEFTATGGAYKWGAGVTREAQETLIRKVITESTEKAAAHVAEQAAVKGVKHEAIEMAKGVVPWLAGSAVQEAASVPRLAAAVGQQLAPDLSEKPLSPEDKKAADQLDAIGTQMESYKPQIDAAAGLNADVAAFNQAQQSFAPLNQQMQAAVTAHDAKIGALNQEMARSGQALEAEQTRFTERVDAWKRRGSPNSEVALINAQQAQLNLHIQAFTQRQSEVQQEAAQAQVQLDAVRGPYEQQFNALKAQGASLEPRIAEATKARQEMDALQKQAEPLQRRLTKAQSRDLHTMLQDYHDDFLPALGKAFGDQFVEIASERTGEAPGELFALLGKSQLGQRLAGSVVGRAATSATERVAGLKAAVLDRWLRLSPKNTLGRFLDMAAEGTAWSGTIGEIYEERVGDVMRAMQPWLNKPGQAQPPIVRLATGEARPPEQGETAADLAGPRAQALKDLASQISLEGLAFSVPGVIAKVVEAVPLEKIGDAIFGKEKPAGFSVEGATLDQLGEMRQGLQVLRQSLTVPAHVEAITDRLAQVDAQIAKLGGPAAAERPTTAPEVPATEAPTPEDRYAPIPVTRQPDGTYVRTPAGGAESAPIEPTTPEPPAAEPPAAQSNEPLHAAVREQLQDRFDWTPLREAGATDAQLGQALREMGGEKERTLHFRDSDQYLMSFTVGGETPTLVVHKDTTSESLTGRDLYAVVRSALGIRDTTAQPGVEAGAAAEPAAPESKLASIGVTRDARQQLYDLGYSRTDVNAMSGDAAGAILAAGTAKPSAKAPSAAPAKEGPQWRVPQEAIPHNPFTGGRAVLDPAEALNRTLRDQTNRLKAIAQLKDWQGRPQNANKKTKQAKWAGQITEIQQEYEKDWGLVDKHLVGVDVPALRKQIEAGETPQFPEMTFAERKGEPGGRPRRNQSGTYALEDALSPVAQQALDEMYHDYTASRRLRIIRGAMEVYHKLLDMDTPTAQADASALLDATEKFFRGEADLGDVHAATHGGLQTLTGELDPDEENELTERQIDNQVDAAQQGKLIFSTLNPQTGEFDVQEFNTAFGTLEFKKDPRATFPPPATTVDATKTAGPVISQADANAQIEAWKAAAKEVGRTEDNSNKVIISLFDVSGNIAQPWKDAGYTVLQFDIKNKKDLTKLGKWMQEVQTHIDEGYDIEGILAQPPCTSFARISGAQWWKTQHDIPNESMVAKKYGLWAAKEFDTPLEYANTLVSIVKLAVAQANPGFYVMENPVGRIDQQNNLPKPALTFDPNVYGEPYTKKTQLWGEFNTALPTAHVEATEGSKIHKLRGDIEEDKAERSVTPTGFAYAFFMANHPSAEAALGKPAPAVSAPAVSEPAVSEPAVSRTIGKKPSEMTAAELSDLLVSDLDKIGTDEPVAPRAEDVRYVIHRSGQQRGSMMYVESVDQTGAAWVTTRAQAGELTKAEVAQVVNTTGDTGKISIRHADDPSVVVPVETVQGYVGQDENDEAIYDPSQAWGAAPVAARDTGAPIDPDNLPPGWTPATSDYPPQPPQSEMDAARAKLADEVATYKDLKTDEIHERLDPLNKKQTWFRKRGIPTPDDYVRMHALTDVLVARRQAREAAKSRPAKSQPTVKAQEKPHAAEIREEPKSDQPEHPGDGEVGAPAEAGGRRGAVERPAVPEAPQVDPSQLTRRQFETDPRAQIVPKGHILASKPADIESGKAFDGRSKDDLQTLARAVGVWIPATITKAQLGERIQKMVTLRQFLAGTTVEALQGYPRSELLKMARLANKKTLSYLDRHQLASALITWAQHAQAEGNVARAHALHYEAVRQALKQGETVPEQVLKDYPDLVKASNLGEIDTGLPEASDSLRGRDTAPEDATLEGDRGAPAPGPRPAQGGRTGAGQARPDRLTRYADAAYLDTVLPDAQAQGYAGDLDKLRRIFDDRARAAREFLEDMQDINSKESGAALLAAIRSYGGIRPFAYEVIQGAPTRKLRGEWETAVSSFRAQGIFGKRSIFRDTGHELDFILDRLHQNGQWRRIVDEEALKEEILRLALGLDDVNYMEITEGDFLGALRAAGVQPGEPWWQDYDGTMDFNVDELEAVAPAPTVDTLDTGEAQPRLPGDVGEVRGAETATPEFEAPFTLTSELSTAPDAIERGLFDGAEPPVPPAPESAAQVADRVMGDLGIEPAGAAERREAIVFRSGNQRDKAALRGYIQAGVPVGITALKENGKPIDGDVRQMIVDYARAGGHVFVDSGVVGNPDLDFDQVMASYAHLAVDVGEEGAKHLYIVAPDMLRQLPDGMWVGDPEKSRALQAQYQEQIRGFIAAGVQVIVPIQIGPDMAQHAIDTIAQFPGLRMGLPTAHAAITLERLQELMDTVAYSHGQYITGVHFLGLSELNKKFDAFAATVRAALPQADITADASRTSSMMRTGRPAHTEVKARKEGRAEELIDAQWDADTTEMAGEFFRGNFDAFTPTDLKKLADTLNISVAQLKKEAAGEGGVQAAVDATGLEDALFQKFYDIAKGRMLRQEGPKARTEVIAESQQPAKSRPAVSLPTQQAKAEAPAPAAPAAEPKPQSKLERIVADLKARKEREKAQPPKPPDVLYQDDDGTAKKLVREDVVAMVEFIDESLANGVTDFGEVVKQFHAMYGEGAHDLDAAVERAWMYRTGETRTVVDVLPRQQPAPEPPPPAPKEEEAPPPPEQPEAPPPAPDYSAEREALGNEPVDFGKHKAVLIKDLYAQQPGYVAWLMDTATTPRARLVIDYVQHQPEYLAAQQQTTTTARAALTEDVVNTLKRLRITATTRADGQVQLEGKLFDYKDIFNEENIRAARTSDGTFIRIVPADKLAIVVDRIKERVSDQRAENRRPYYESDPELSQLRTTADDWPDSKLLGADGGASLRSRRTEALIDRGTKIGIPHFVLDEQKEDVSRINAAYQAGKPLFILASEPGSGKTYVLGGAIRELRAAGAKTFTYVTKSKDLIEQIQHNLKDFDIGDVKFLTYTTLRDVPPEASDVLIFDESHEVKNAKGSVQGKRAADWMAQARFTIASSATPFENPAQAEYLDATHVFDRPFGTEANDYEDAFTRFAKAFGAQIEEFKLPNGRIASRPVWYRTATSDADSAAARQWLTREGVFSSRRIRLPDDQVDTRLVPIQAPTEHAEQYRQFSQAALDLEYTLPSFSKAWIKNTQKRLLEASKVDQGITEARSALHRGRFPIIFVETKAERIYDINDLKEREARYQRDAALAARARAPKPDRADPAYQGRDENGEPNGEGLPPEGIVPVLAHFQELSGQDTIEIPSAESLIQDAFGKNQVAIYTGSVSPEKAKSNLEKWRAGTMPVLVATMAKGGTGLSLHDTVGDHQTTQINVNMPWTATGVVQVSQRSARYGLQGRAELMWIFAENIPMDAVLGRRVGGRMADMGAVIHGERLRGSDEIENADYDDMSFSEIHESLQASGEAAVPFDSESLQRIMGLPENHADSVIALQHAMALEPQRVGGKVVGVRKGGVPREGALQQPELALVRDRWQRTRLVSVTDAALALGNEIPGYIQAVGSFILQQRERLLTGRMTPRDIAKAYLLTLGSIQAQAINLDTFVKKTGLRPTPDFITVENGVEKVRPEEAVAYWMFTPAGQRALDSVEEGRIKDSQWQSLLRVRDAYGANTIRANAFKQAPGAWSLHHMAEATHAVNDAHGDSAAIGDVVKKLAGIGDGKEGFIKSLLGIGDTPTVDRREVNFWLTGKATTRDLDTVRAQLARDVQNVGLKSRTMGPEVTARIQRQVGRLAERQGMDPTTAAHLIHHMLWDMSAGTETTHTGLMKAMTLAQAGTPLPTASPAFQRFFGDSKVVDVDGNPLRVYHGTRRLDRIGPRFLKGRATSGPMPFFTNDPALASNYALNKPDTSYEQPDDYAGWFQFRVGRSDVPIDRAWYFLTPEQRAKVAELLPQVTHLDKDGKELNNYRQSHDPQQTGLAGRDHWDYEITQARGNVLRAAVEVWLNSAGIYDSEEDFMRILELGGMPMEGVRYESPWKQRPGVVPVYLSIQKPLDTSAIPTTVVDALQRASRGRRARGWGSDIFDKNRRDPKGWMEELREDIATGRNPQAWTSIPDWVTETLKRQGYDGIRDRSGKFTPGESHDVWIPFEPTQIKSALSNRGTYDPRKPNILYQGGRQATLDFGPQTETQAFKGWFKDSAAVDADDNPLVVYHATPTSFNVFKPGGKDVRVSGPAMWFTSDREVYPAAHHVGGYEGKYVRGTNVMPVFLSVQNPVRVTNSNQQELGKHFGIGAESAFPRLLTPAAVKAMKEAGHDGVFLWAGDNQTAVPDELVVFDPTQIKSAIGNRGTFSPTSPNILYQQDQPFYSRLTRAVEGAKQNKATGAQWKGIIKNAKTGINQDEYVYASVDDLEAGKTYTKQEVLDYLAANNLKVETVTFGGHTEAEIADIGERLDRAGYGLDGDPDSDRIVKLVPVNDQGEFTGAPVAMAIGGDVSLVGDWSATERPSESVLQDFSDFVNSNLTPPRYAQHTEPGADVGTQREVFLTVAPDPRAPTGHLMWDHGKTVDVNLTYRGGGTGETLRYTASTGEGAGYTITVMVLRDGGGVRYVVDSYGAPGADARDRRVVNAQFESLDAAKAEAEERFAGGPVAKTWKDGHDEYDDVVNPIVRVRFNVRSQVSYTVDQINDIGQRIAKAVGAKHPDHIASGSFDVAIRKGAVTAKEAAQYAHAHRFYLNDQTGALDRIMFIEEVQPPSEDNQKKMPPLLVKNWRELGFKWALRHAAEKGYDAVAWTTGETQARRYGLEKHVRSIKWGPAFPGAGQLVVIALQTGGQPVRLTLDGDGMVTKTDAYRDRDFEGRSIADVVGKEIGQRITRTHVGELSGEGLKIGGEGLKRLYDVDFPRVVNSLSVVKRAGVRVGTRELLFGGGWGRLAQTRRQEGFLDVPAIEMTGDLRQALLGGQALFQGPKAAVEFQSHGYDALVRALDSPNVSSAVHELAHIARRWLFDPEIPRDQRRGITDQDIMTAAVWSGARVVGGKVFWTEAAEEKFANGFERYLRDGEAPVPELRDLFRKFAQWLKDIYQTIFGTRLDLDISPAMREVYDHLVIRSMTVEAKEPSKPPPAVSRPAVSQPTTESRGPPSMLFQQDDEPGDTDTKPYGFVTPSDAEPTTRKARRAAERTPLVEFEIPEAEARYQKAHGIKAEGAWDKVGRFKEDLVKITRHFPELDPSASPFHAVAQDLLLDYERSGEWAQLRAHNRIAGFVKDLKKNEVDLFARALILPDILQDHEKGLYDGKTGEELPYGLTKDQVAREIERVNAVVAEHPNVQKALAERAAFVQQLTKELVKADLLPRSTLDNKAYYHRQVMTYFQPPEPSATAPVVTKGSVRQRKRGFQWTRSGGGDFNTHYIQSEYEWVAQALKELKTKATLEKLKAVFDTSQSLRTLAKERNYERLGAQLATKAGMDAIKDGPHFAKEALKPWKREKAHAIEQLLLALSSREPGRYIVSPGLQSVVDDLAERYTEYLTDNIDIAPKDREPFDSSHPQWWALMKDLVQHKTLAAKWAAAFMRANIGEEKFIKASLGDAYIDRRSPEDLLSLADPGYSTHQPDPGNLFYRATSIDDKLFDAVVAGSRELSAKDKREVLAMGGPKETWIIPTWLKDTLDRIGAAKTPGALDVPDRAVKAALAAWKQSVLLLPHRVLKYNVNNFTGDADAVLAYAPGIFLRIPQAISFLHSQDTQRHERLVELGVMNAGLSHVELPDVTTLAGFRHLAEESPQEFMVRQLTFGGTYFEKVRGMTEWRENILRVAAYDYILNQVRADKKVYAASNATRVDAMRTAVNDAKAQVDAAKKGTAAERATADAALVDAQERLAALLARELVGDYRAVSAFTTEMRSRLLPFFSFQEINLRRYVQLFKNAGREEAGLTGLASRFTRTAGTAATGFSLRMAARVGTAWLIKFAMVNLFMGAVSLWNHLLFPDETEEMRRRGRQQLHLMLGRWSDGSIRSVRVEGAFSDFLEWIGSQNYIEDIFALSRGDITGVEKLWEMGKAPVNKIVQSWEPFFKMGAEQIAGKRAFPDAFRATPIRDRGEHLAGLFSLDGLYSRVTGKPQTGKILSVDTATRLLLLNTDPGEAAYYDTRENVIKYLKSKHKEQPGMEPTEKQNALFYYKKALQWDDADAAQRWLLEYRRLAGDKGKLLPRDEAKDAITASIQGAAPLAMLSYERQAEFRKSLSPRDRASLHMAEVWYRRTYGREAIRQKAQ
jgi:ADP-Ribosyltransferase in polyvalent proteins/D-alanyl-D-alanine carboxypeptidase/Type III restriction enzyme, res subunit